MSRVANTARPKGASADRNRLLIAHAFTGMAEVVSLILSQAGYDCRRVSTRASVYRLLNKRIKFDALFLHVGALENFGKLRKWALHGAGKRLPVVLTAVRPRSSIPGEFLDRANIFLPAPFLREQLLRAMRRVLAR